MTTPATITDSPTPHLRAERTRDRSGHHWSIVTEKVLADAVAANLTFWAYPEQVVLGETVILEDPEGTRIGHITSATYHEPPFRPGYVIVSITLM